VGGVSERPTRATEEQSFEPPGARVATVKGTLVRRMPSAFAGGRRNASLGRSVSSAGGSFPGRQTHRRQQVSSGRMRRGTSSACAKRTHSSRWRLISGSLTRTRPSLGPETRARQSSLSSAGASQRRWRVDSGIAVGQTHASGSEPATGSRSADEARLAAYHRSSRSRATASLKRSCVMRQKRKVVLAIVPARNESPELSVRTSCFKLQKSAGSILAPNKLLRSARKRVAVGVNGGLARRNHRRENVGGGAARRKCWRVGLHGS
jgi:hypothetical protein